MDFVWRPQMKSSLQSPQAGCHFHCDKSAENFPALSTTTWTPTSWSHPVILNDLNWVAKPLQPGRGQQDGISWTVGSTSPPPLQVFTSFGKEVLITETTKQQFIAKAPAFLASSMPRSTCAMKSALQRQLLLRWTLGKMSTKTLGMLGTPHPASLLYGSSSRRQKSSC